MTNDLIEKVIEAMIKTPPRTVRTMDWDNMAVIETVDYSSSAQAAIDTILPVAIRIAEAPLPDDDGMDIQVRRQVADQLRALSASPLGEKEG